ncbi:hypothetical protein [Acaryochloris sp. CCMEE 5410]|uniref:hypothetical protein n=1 Tax=Acaryochloris sp. CCMEE 5410 TaxID=310037 RepID=UPI000248502E|nr:hypothetical protein [Acaryochloris sp. CCMEE 5410]KAI9130094.1 hypothetical protein ON05_031175 [Acaryochloris sp. CCMEE 5410]
MTTNPSVKQRLLTEIEQLPESQLTEVLRFVGTLQANPQHGISTMEPTPDPLSSFIGAVSHGSLAQEVDADLYGD